MHKPVNVLGL